MTIPDSLQKLGDGVFYQCSKLVSSSIDVNIPFKDKPSEVVAHLSSKQKVQQQKDARTRRSQQKTK